MQHKTQVDASDLTDRALYLLASEIGEEMAARLDGGSGTDDSEATPQEATAKALHRRLRDVPNVGLQTCKKLVEAGYDSLSAIIGDPFGLTDVDGIGSAMASNIHGAAKEADDDIPRTPDTSRDSEATQERILAGEAMKEVPDGARLVTADGTLLAVVNQTDEGYTAEIDGQTVAHPRKGSPLSNASGLAWAVGEHLGEIDDGNQLKDEAFYIW